MQAQELYTLWSTGRSGAGLSAGKAEFATECPLTVPAVVSRLESFNGSLFAGLGQPAAALAACDHRDCVDRFIVLFRLSRQQPAAPKSPDLLEKGVDGAMWAVHGGGFYNPQKYMVAPKKIHTELHWFYWESYSTWLSGFALFTVLYLYNAGTFLIDKSLMDWSPAAAISAALGFLVAFWLIYDRICQWFGFREKGDAIVGALVFAVICVASWAACQLFAGRAAFLLVGAMIATVMSANVFFWIIPGQRKVVAAMTSGEKVDPKALAIHGKRGKQRSVHNTYFTLPVIFAMLSNHYGFLYTNKYNWAVLILMMLAGALIRQFFVQRHGWHHGRAANPWPFAAVGVVLILAVIVGMKALEPVPVPAAATTDTRLRMRVMLSISTPSEKAIAK
jgi:uncharacterized membrane protein